MRWGLVLGGGGVLGAAWMVGALTAFAEHTGRDPRQADLIVGTSAGSLLGALLGAGVSIGELCGHQLGKPASSGPLAELDWDYDTATGGTRPQHRRFGMGSWALVRQGPGRLRKVPPSAVIAALMPEGRGSLETVGRLVEDLQRRQGRGIHEWSAHPGVRAVAMDYSTGRRVSFGEPDAPPAGLAEAVMASCALPGWYPPVVIGGERYVDGGAASATNIDLTTGHDLQEVFALAPMASFVDPLPPSYGRIDRLWRQRVTRRALRETRKARDTGLQVTLLVPGPRDVLALGPNLMDVTRRRQVLDTALETARQMLAEPQTLQHQTTRAEDRLAELDDEDDTDEDPYPIPPDPAPRRTRRAKAGETPPEGGTV